MATQNPETPPETTENPQSTTPEQNPTQGEPTEVENEDQSLEDRLENLRAESAAAVDDIGEKHLKNKTRLAAAHDAMMLQDAHHTLRDDRESRNRGMAEILNGGPLPENQSASATLPRTGRQADGVLAGMEDMINLGDIRVQINQEPTQATAPLPAMPPPQPPVQTEPPPPPPKPEAEPSTKKKLGKWAKAGIGALLAGSTLGAGAAIPFIWDAIKGKPEVPQQTIPDYEDTDSYYELRLHPPE